MFRGLTIPILRKKGREYRANRKHTQETKGIATRRLDRPRQSQINTHYQKTPPHTHASTHIREARMNFQPSVGWDSSLCPSRLCQKVR